MIINTRLGKTSFYLKNCFLLFASLAIFVFLSLIHSTIAGAHVHPQPVYKVCKCKFPAEVGAFGHLKVVSTRYALFRHIRGNPMIVREILAERKGKKYRILSLVASSETSSVGKAGPIIEIIKYNDFYQPNKVIYQLPIDQIYFAYLKLE